MLDPPYQTAVIGRTGRGDYGHGLDVAVLNHPKLKVVAVADEDARGRAQAAKRLRVERAYDDYRAMLAREKPQFVVVAPRWLDGHKDMILACAEHGVLGIFCEKPLAPDLASCDAIIAACERSHVKLASAFQTRYSPRYERVKALIAAGSDRRGARAPRAGQGGPSRRGRGPDGAGRPHPRSLPRPARGAGVVLRPRLGTRAGRGPGGVPAGSRGDRTAGGRPDRRHVRLPGDRGRSLTSQPPARLSRADGSG